MNTYASLNQLKTRLDITGTTWDADYMLLLGAASREIDKLTRRFFYCKEGIRYYDGCGRSFFPPDDILSVTSIYLDEDGSGTFSSLMAASDFVSYPLNDYPKTWLSIATQSNYASFANSVRNGIKMTGVCGYGDGESATPYSDSGVVLGAGCTAGATSLSITPDGVISPGHTIRIATEQLYVTATDAAAHTITVSRGSNGTTAASHLITTAISIYAYPEPIREACIIQAARWWKRRDSAYQDVIVSPQTGTISVTKGLDPDVELILKKSSYMRVILH